MKKKDIVIGLVVIALVLVLFYRLKTKEKQKKEPPPTPAVQEKIEESFNVEIPEDVEKTELKDVAGGNASGMATRKFENGVFSLLVLADLPDAEAGSFYEGWLVKGKVGETDFDIVSTGKLRQAKGGYLLEFKSAKDYSDYNQVVVTLEKKPDNLPEKHILEGSF